jgi:hypothetical protein
MSCNYQQSPIGDPRISPHVVGADSTTPFRAARGARESAKKTDDLRPESLSATLTRQSEESNGDPGTTTVSHDFRVVGKSILQTRYLITSGPTASAAWPIWNGNRIREWRRSLYCKSRFAIRNDSMKLYQPSGYRTLQYLRQRMQPFRVRRILGGRCIRL